METSFEYRIYPTCEQAALIERTFGCCRWVYNRVLAQRKEDYATGRRFKKMNTYITQIPKWKREEAPWLAEVDSMALQQALRNLNTAYKNFFRDPGRVGFPKFKSKNASRQSYRTNVARVVDARHVKLPKLGIVKARVSRPIEGRVLSATVKRVPSGKYFVVFCCTDAPAPEAPPAVAGMVGIDAGVSRVATRSDGVILANQRNLEKAGRKLAREQRRLSRKRRGSANREKQRVKVARAHEKVANRRKDTLHKFTIAAVRESQGIAVEDLNVSGMMRNKRLAKVLSDAAMSELLRQLEYKCARFGRDFVRVGRFYPSSKTCSGCGHVLDELPLSVREWTCPACGEAHDRDLNAALNIAAEGLRILNGTAGHAGTGTVTAVRTLLEQA